MSLWWARRDQLDKSQVDLIENLPLDQSHLILGAPGSGKTNVLLRRAQFVRSQDMPNVLVMTFTRALTEFVKTGCFDAQGREIFPQTCVTTLERWLRDLYRQHGLTLPQQTGPDFAERKKSLALGALGFAAQGKIPQYDALFIDEAQDLILEEVQLLTEWSNVLFLVGDSRQKIYEYSNGLEAIRQTVPRPAEHTLLFHYRLSAELCKMADRILQAQGGQTLAATSHYNGPKPGRIGIHGPLQRSQILKEMTERLRDQIRAYADLIQQGDLLGVIVARRNDRDAVFAHLEADAELAGKSQIVRAREGLNDTHDVAIRPSSPICILTVKACKGLEFRAVHWPFCEELASYHNPEHYYTVITRAKTSLDAYYTSDLPQELARSYAAPRDELW
jgi:superfamily I DNA/RNA helicase